MQSTLGISNSDTCTILFRYLRNSKRLPESKIAFSDYTLALDTFFTSPNYPKCKLICNSGNLNLQKMVPKLRDIKDDCTALVEQWYSVRLYNGRFPFLFPGSGHIKTVKIGSDRFVSWRSETMG